MDKINNRLSGEYLVDCRGFRQKKEDAGHITYQNGSLLVSIHKDNIFIRLIGSKEVLVSSPNYTIAKFESLLHGLELSIPVLREYNDEEIIKAEAISSEITEA